MLPLHACQTIHTQCTGKSRATAIRGVQQAVLLIYLVFCLDVQAAPQRNASEWFADEDASTEIVQIGARQATHDAYYHLIELATLAAAGIALLLWRQRRREHAMLLRLRDTEERLRETQAIANVGSWTRDFATGETYWSTEARALLMLDEQLMLNEELMLDERLVLGDEQKKLGHYETFVHPDDLPLVTETIASAYCRGGLYHCDHRVVCPNGVVKYVRLVGRIYLSGKGGGAVFEHGTVQDITERKLIEQHLRENEDNLRSVLDGAPMAILVVDLSEGLVVRYANPAFFRLFELPADNDLNALTAAQHWVSKEAFLQFKANVLANDGCSVVEAMLRKANGGLFWGLLQARLTRYCGDDAAIICVQDISAQRAHLEELEKRATLDPLTGVLNSHHLLDVINREFRRALRYNQPVSLCLVSLDQWRALSEGFGVNDAEQLLKQFVDMLKDGVRVEDSIGRLNQEEFLVLLVGATLEGGRMVAERIRCLCEEEYFELQRQTIRLTASAGVATLESANESVDDVLHRTQEALQQARRMGANCVALRVRKSSEQQKKA